MTRLRNWWAEFAALDREWRDANPAWAWVRAAAFVVAATALGVSLMVLAGR